MRSWLHALVLALALVSGPAVAMGSPVPAGSPPSAAAAPAAEPAMAEPVEQAGHSLRVERTARKPSGFWTSTLPAQGGAYRYRLLGIGTAVALITLVFMIWLVRRKAREAA